MRVRVGDSQVDQRVDYGFNYPVGWVSGDCLGLSNIIFVGRRVTQQ